MAQPIVMPKPGQMTETCSIIRWLKKEGDPVSRGDILFEIETDKAAMEVESFFAGTLLKILLAPGIAVPVQSVVGFIGQPGEAIPAAPAPPPAASSGPATTPATATATIPAPAPPRASARAAAAPPPAAAAFKISPRAARLARESVIDPAPISGTGHGGRVMEKDVRAYLAAKGYDRLRITPAAKELARREGIDVLAVRATGETGRVGTEDVERAITERPRPLSRMRQVIAERLTRSVTTAPHFFVTVAVDMTPLTELRRELKASGRSYSFNDFLLRACALTLKEIPEVNSTTDGRSVRRQSRVHLGMAVSVESGLVVPVIRDADELSLDELRDRAGQLGEKAQLGKLTPDEMTGSTFSISNMGMLDVESFTAIINPGESAILAVSSIVPRPVVRDGQIVIRNMMKMTLSSDHRLIDGALAARFVNAVKARLEDIEAWKNSTSS